MKNKALKGCMTTLLVVLAVIIITILALPIIINIADEYEKNKQIERAEIIGNYILEGIADNSLSTETVYYLFADYNKNGKNSLLPAKKDEIKEIIDSKKFVDAYALDENSVLISEGAIFQKVTGYIVTNGKAEIGKSIEVPEEFMYDGNTVRVTSEVKENVYAFYTGV